jgi:hypothetical protein
MPGCAGCSAAFFSDRNKPLSATHPGDRRPQELEADASRDGPQQPLGCEAMSLPSWRAPGSSSIRNPTRDRDDNFFAMMDYESDMAR